MDTSETYIKMCEKAKEIQALERTVSDNIMSHYTHDGKSTWLPRQDQLQEMVSVPIGTFNDNFWTILEDLRDWGHNYAEFQQWIPLSMEQLWLAFVMNEKYNKVWNGEDWVK